MSNRSSQSPRPSGDRPARLSTEEIATRRSQWRRRSAAGAVVSLGVFSALAAAGTQSATTSAPANVDSAVDSSLADESDSTAATGDQYSTSRAGSDDHIHAGASAGAYFAPPDSSESLLRPSLGASASGSSITPEQSGAS